MLFTAVRVVYQLRRWLNFSIYFIRFSFDKKVEVQLCAGKNSLQKLAFTENPYFICPHIQ